MSDMPNSLESMRVETETDSDLNDNAPLWKYVTKHEKMGKCGGNMSFKCNFFQHVYKGSYYRVKNHLLKMKGGGIASCFKVTVANLSEMQKVLEEAELRVKQSLPRQVPLPTTVGSSSASVSNYFQMDLPFVETKKRKGGGSIEKVFNNNAKEQLDSSDSMNDRSLMGPVKWWINHGASTPTLQSMALKLLGQPCSSSCCERNWSTYNFIHSMKRNKITPQRAEDLIFVHNNLRLLSRRSQTYNESVSHLWDVGGVGFDSMDMDNAGYSRLPVFP
ncbi:hypothetical protein Dsin_008122 [Dipteronia sinensis]|uniref:HAT C-terminal dimerisation domain-containing protein n=1 Tax=Dipteronia sinensis TaxID=43782 RepID=A0AAE0B2W4_9ROSI|nr:hypothetical protein Dsin_008122 [Dipteronia sinensis]